MNILSRLWGALNALTQNVADLAETVRTINTGLRQRVGLDDVGLELPAIEQATPADEEPASGGRSKRKGG